MAETSYDTGLMRMFPYLKSKKLYFYIPLKPRTYSNNRVFGNVEQGLDLIKNFLVKVSMDIKLITEGETVVH